MNDVLTAEQSAAILWPGFFKKGWRDKNSDDPFFQAECYCLKKAEELLENIEVRYKNNAKSKI